jgi:hypothetical protein
MQPMQPIDWKAIEARQREEAREQLGKVEDQIRQTYRQVAGDERGRFVSLAELRAALPAELSREQVDAALVNLRDHSDVHMVPRTDQRNAGPETRAAALAAGGTYDHQMSIDYTQHPERVAERLHSRDEDRAWSMVAALSDSKALEVARQMGVPASAGGQGVRADLVAASVSNRDAWLANARQGETDGKLLYRADTEPDWAASLTSGERQELAAAAARLQQRADTEPAWAYVKDRADRWADPGTSTDSPTPAREVDGTARQRGADTAGEQYANDRQDTEHDPADADPFGYEAEARDADEALAERMRTDIDQRRQVLSAARGKDPADMNREEYAAWSADADDRYADGYGDRQAADYVDRMTDRDLAGQLDPQRDTAEVQTGRDHQDATLEYAVGDDLVIGGVVYDRDQWQPDGEGGVEPRLSGEEELARQARQAEIEESNDRNREAELAYDAEAAVDYSGPGGDHDLASDERFESQWPETKNFEDLTPAEQAPSVAAELRDARTYLEQRAARDTAPREPAERDTAAQQEQAHRESARVLAERQQTEPQRGIER